MAEININVIDGIGVNKEQNAILLLLCDYLEWDSEKAMKHSEHLFLLRKKIDTYVKFLEKVKEALDNNHIEIPYQQLDVHMK